MVAAWLPSDVNEFELELARVLAIRDAHRAHVEKARSFAEALSEEASFLSEEGPRETEAESGDEDGEAASDAATARAASERAVLAFKRVRELDSVGDALAFGRITFNDDEVDLDDKADPGEVRYIGRHSVIDGDHVWLIDWRAPAAELFYRATPLEPQGITHRRHLHYKNDDFVDFSDEVFDDSLLDGQTELRGEAALLSTLAQRSTERLESVVATIQAEQDAVIRASADGPLLVQGGPGTGKTVVALHRAAYLLYADRAALAETGVLIVGPSNEFLSYISNVLPSLGESGVISSTANRLYPGVKVDPDPDQATAELKGSVAMATVLEAAVALRRRRPKEELTAFYGSRRLQASIERLTEFFTVALRRRSYNAGSGVFRRLIVEELTGSVFEPGFGGRDEIRAGLEQSGELAAFFERHWPVLSPEQALNDLFGSPGLLRVASERAGLSAAQQQLLLRDRTPEAELWWRRWHEADVPLLDELLHLLGDVTDANDDETDMEHIVRIEDDVFEGVDDEEVDDDDGETIELSEHEDVESYDAWREGDDEASNYGDVIEGPWR